jgi:hypothetical protein
MAAYLGSLRQLVEQADAAEPGFDWIAPGHGYLMSGPQAVLRGLIAHRLRREDKVVAALRELAAQHPAALEGLLARVYDDVPAERHPIAARSLLAHLLKLQKDERVLCVGDRWMASAREAVSGMPKEAL